MRRKILLLLAITASSALFLAATPTPASAACSVASGSVYRPTPWSNLDLHFYITGCTGVNLVRFYGSNYGTGWWDVATSTLYPTQGRTFEQYDTYYFPPTSQPEHAWIGHANVWEHRYCWYAGQTRILQNKLMWKWRSSSGVWSVFQSYTSPSYAFAC